MPTTLAGFLLLAGLLLIILSLLAGGLKVKDVAVPGFKTFARIVLAVLGIACLAVSGFLYYMNWSDPEKYRLQPHMYIPKK